MANLTPELTLPTEISSGGSGLRTATVYLSLPNVSNPLEFEVGRGGRIAGFLRRCAFVAFFFPRNNPPGHRNSQSPTNQDTLFVVVVAGSFFYLRVKPGFFCTIAMEWKPLLIEFVGFSG